MAFDAARGELVMFGGQLLPSPANADTWVWNGTNWTQRSPAASPGARQYHAMCYDAGRQRVVVYSGQLGTALLNDIWEWDGTTWTHPLPAGLATGAATGPSSSTTARASCCSAAARAPLRATTPGPGTARRGRS
jgi:hypothetical protein